MSEKRPTEFGSKRERIAALLHSAKMRDCYGTWELPSRFEWPETREQWEHYRHHPHSVIEITMAQAKAIEPFVEGLDRERRG